MLRRSFGVLIVLLLTGLVVLRIQKYAAFERPPQMPPPISDAAERELFFSPKGAYTAADIVANGNQLPTEKFRGFTARHDIRPQPGDALCPITRTKANPTCTWIVSGRKYSFCCPPCIPEFVRQAKNESETLQPYSKSTSR